VFSRKKSKEAGQKSQIKVALEANTSTAVSSEASQLQELEPASDQRTFFTFVLCLPPFGCR
jgi:hypothetical protein